jgi:hypothetical protein
MILFALPKRIRNEQVQRGQRTLLGKCTWLHWLQGNGLAIDGDMDGEGGEVGDEEEGVSTARVALVRAERVVQLEQSAVDIF